VHRDQPAVLQALRRHDPEESKGGREPRTRIFPLVDAMFADSQLALGGKEPRRQDGSGLHQCQEEAERISGKLPDGSGGTPHSRF